MSANSPARPAGPLAGPPAVTGAPLASPPIDRPPQPIPEQYLDLFQKKAFGYLGTLMPNGTPQVTPVWLDLQDGYVVINSVKGQQKDRNIRTRRRVALCVSDPEDPYRYVTIRGPVVEITEQGADEVISRLAAKYTGDPHYQKRPGEVRVTYRIRPDHISVQG